MNFTDTHCHLADPALRNCLPEIFQQCEAQGVMRFMVPATQRCDWADVTALLQNVPTQIRTEPIIHIALGIHPWFIGVSQNEDFVLLEHLLQQYPQAWVGEIGLDFLKHTDEAQRQRQIESFSRQLELAQCLQRKVVIHNVKATAAIVREVQVSGFTQGGIVHAFSGSVEDAQRLVKLGFKIGIGSLLLNPNAKKLRQVVQQINASDMVLETDSPFMLRNEVNTPVNIRRIAEIVADLRGTDLAEISDITEQNVSEML